jgi:hypothetical protein
MPDPMDELEHFTTPGLTMTPLSASEVRRRGNRMRRRNNALATVGGIAAVAIIATPIALAATGGPSADPQPPIATQPAGGWKQDVPADFDIAALPAGSTFTFDAQDEPAIDQVRVCGAMAFDTTADDAVTDTAGATTDADANTDGGTGRTLAVYTDAEAAQAALDELRQGVTDCPVEEQPRGLPLVNDVLDGEVAGTQDSLVWTNQAKDGDVLSDMTVFEAARVGNALYLAFSHSALGGEQAQANVTLLLQQSAPVVDQMCTFSIEGCAPAQPDASEAVDEPTGLTGAIPDSFPLEKGLPTDPQGGVGIEGPSHDLDLAPYNLENNLQACGTAPQGLPEPADTLNAGFRSAGLGVLRQLHTFDSVEDAQAYAEGVMAPFASCVEEPEGGVTRIHEVTPEQVGDHASSAVVRFELDGEPGPGYEVVQVVRVGQAVLLTVAASEEAPAQAPDEMRAMYLENSQSVIDEMN